MASPLRIIRFEAENFKRLKAVRITPHGNMIQLTGANGSGKSSVLDAIYAALAGKGAAPTVPIREGEESAVITLDLGRIKVTRRFGANQTSLVVESEDGAVFPSPQTMLDKLVGALSFDPLEFTRLSAKEQRAALGKLVGVDHELKVIETHRRTTFEERTLVNRDVTKLKASVEAIPEESVEAVDVAELFAEIEEVEAHNRAVEQALAKARADEEVARGMRKAALVNQHEATRLRAEADRLDRVAATCEADAERLESSICRDFPAMRDAAPLKQRIADAQAINERAAQQRRRHERLVELTEAEHRVFYLTEQLKDYDRSKQLLVERANLPVPGLGFTEDGVTFKGLPFEQASGAEQLRVSVAIAMAANPTLRVLRIKDGSLLDPSSLEIVADMLREHDYQLWIERVDVSGKVGIVMQDGEALPDPFEDDQNYTFEAARLWQEHDAMMREETR